MAEEQRHGSPVFYKLLEEMAETHDQKSHDYASNTNPYGNYEFAGQMAVMFSHSPQDAGFVGRLAEKIYRLANLEGSRKIAKNESIEDTERDIAVIVALWMANRRERRLKNNATLALESNMTDMNWRHLSEINIEIPKAEIGESSRDYANRIVQSTKAQIAAKL